VVAFALDPLAAAPPPPLSEIRPLAEAVVNRAEAKAELADGATVDIDLLDGDPRLLLREAATQADLLVLGARGHRGVAHLVMGSVTTSLVHHPTAPTVVVPG
jgi:nucleotide-binding universal stress UspA family protein